MAEYEMNEAERKALSEANRLFRRIFDRAFPSGAAATRRRRHSYHYWETPDQRMFCYTPWKDRNGNYWTWVMKPYGKGSLSGKATKWKRVGRRVRSRTRKLAMKRAHTRYNNWLKYKFTQRE